MTHFVVHGFWRSSSTYFWAKARGNSSTIALYEPFNSVLSGPVADLRSSSGDWNSRHPSSDRYFREIVSLYKALGVISYPQISGEWESLEYFMLTKGQRLHIHHLIKAHLQTQFPNCFWGFCRGVAKLSAIHNYIVQSQSSQVVSILLHREPLQQFSSYVYQSSSHNFSFESRPYRLWTANRLATEITPAYLRNQARNMISLTNDDLWHIMSGMSSRLHLSAYLYAAMIVKSMACCLRGWHPEGQKEFTQNHCFVVDNLNVDKDAFARLSRIFSQGGLEIDLSDFHLERQREPISCSQMVTAFSCVIKFSPSALASARIRHHAIYDYFRRLSTINDEYSFCLSTYADSVRAATKGEEVFMSDVQREAEEFVLLADNHLLRRKLAYNGNELKAVMEKTRRSSEILEQIREKLLSVKSDNLPTRE